MTNDQRGDYDGRATSGVLGAFGKELMSRAFDEAIRATRSVLSGTGAAAPDRLLHERLRNLSENEREAAAELARASAVEALHGLLYRASDGSGEFQLLFRGVDIAAESDGLHGDLFIWIRDLSEFPHDWEQDGPLLR